VPIKPARLVKRLCSVRADYAGYEYTVHTYAMYLHQVYVLFTPLARSLRRRSACSVKACGTSGERAQQMGTCQQSRQRILYVLKLRIAEHPIIQFTFNPCLPLTSKWQCFSSVIGFGRPSTVVKCGIFCYGNVCPSVTFVSDALKRFKISNYALHRTVQRCLLFR